MATTAPAHDQYALIIGAMKSGTSALFDLLSQHPQVCPSRIKEPEYFSRAQGHGMTVGRYADLWSFDPAVHRMALEASTGYAKFPDEPGVPERIAAAGLAPKFIYVLRHPVERISSQVIYSTWGRKNAVADFTDPHALSLSQYAMQLDRFTAVFPRESILLVDHAALSREPLGVAATVFDFLGLAPCSIKPLPELKNAARPRSAWERRLMGSGALARVAAAAPPSVKAGLRRASGASAAPRPAMSAETAARLRAELEPDMQRLAREWGFDVAAWGFAGSSALEAS